MSQFDQLVPYNPVWDIKDSSKLDDFISCNRLYFFKHILGWHPDVPAHDLLFGSAWHKGREYQLLNGYDRIEGAYKAFFDLYSLHFSQEDDYIYRPKTPTAALKGFYQFATQRERDLIDNEVVEIDGVKMTEIGGTVPISDTRVIHYRMDSIMRRLDNGKIFSWDHKTTTENYIINRSWANQFFLSIQNGTYTHCLYCMFPIEDVLGIEFCGTGFAYLQRGSANRPAGYHVTLRRAPAYKTPDQMNTWLWTVNHYLDQIDREMDYLHSCSDGDAVLTAFPMNHKSCSAYRGCEFHDYCISWQNPLRACGEPPLGFKEEFWDPNAVEVSVRKDLEWR